MTTPGHPGSFVAAGTLTAGEISYRIWRVDAAKGSRQLPFCLKVLLENLLRNEDGRLVTAAHVEALARWDPAAEPSQEIAFTPARVLMQDFTGVPCLVDLAAMREAMAALGGDPARVNPLRPAELIIGPDTICRLHLGLAEGMTEGLGGLITQRLTVKPARRAGCRLTVRRAEPRISA